MSPAELAEVVRLHGLWARGEDGGKRADLTGADLRGATLRDTNLVRADLTVANLRGADLAGAGLAGAYLWGADFTGADLTGANLADAILTDAILTGANLRGAYLTDAILTGANLRGAYLASADLASADLAGAILTGATMPDDRTWEEYRVDHLAGICSEPQVIARALAAWGQHDWRSCPMHSALGVGGLDDIEDDERRRLVACWVALYDSGHLTIDGAVRA